MQEQSSIRSLSRNGKTLLSGVDPVRRCERLADAVSIKDKTLYFCPSPIYGYGLSRLLTRLEQEAPNSAVLCIETDPELYDISIKNITPLITAGKKIRLTNISDAVNLCTFVRNTWKERTFRRLEIVRLTGGWQLFPELYDSLYNTLYREIAVEWSNVLTMTKLGRLYLRNALRNLTLIPEFPSISSLSFGDMPVLVLGAGPSLDETLDILELKLSKKLCSPQDRPFRIVCVDTCLGSLKDRNITPDLVVILESQHWNLRGFSGCRGWDIPAVIDLSALPESAKMLGKGFLFFTPWTELKIFKRLKEAQLLPEILPPLGSVGLTAVEITRRLGSGNIVCAGLDFSFFPDKSHARGTPGHRSKLNSQNYLNRFFNTDVYTSRVFSTLSKSGDPVHSNPAMQNYRNLFEQEFSSDPRIFDITGSGLPLGIKTLSCDEALQKLTAGDCGSTSAVVLKSQPLLNVKENLAAFLLNEKKFLMELKSILTGGAEMVQERFNLENFITLIEDCDYLWAHFPDRRPELTENPGSEAQSFLKRLRMEIDPAILLIDRILVPDSENFL